ncbi:malto-oligosyltrehalose synthase [Halopseudomonas sp.]|uniref:malto-oligosyltrehalose synthase n=1 Tax=Halopseudomonas sp. TaxID=2901191 RepID=UPI00356382D7
MTQDVLIEPRATARLQFHAGFTLEHAIGLVDYFANLGISHIYASPLTRARSGSLHGYDVVDPTMINPELGGEEALERLVQALRERQMGLILDIVPNHMAVSDANPWWHSVLEWGASSPYSDFFDINWHSSDPLLEGRILAPFLGRDYALTLSDGELELDFDALSGTFSVTYFDNRFPLTPPSYADILLSSHDHHLNELAVRFAALDGYRQAPDRAHELCAQLAQLCTSPANIELVHQALATFAPIAGQSGGRMHELLERQHYRLASWRTAADEINWRRFFDINELICLRVESHEVFEAAHAKIFELVERGLVDGLRIDHIDGLADPRGYCRKLRRRVEGLIGPSVRAARFPIYVEKILGSGEVLPAHWNVDGTTGYEFMNQVSLRQHDSRGAAALQRLWASETGRPADFLQEVYDARRFVLSNSLAADFETVAEGLMQLAREDLSTRDLTLNGIRRVLLELIANFTVYRTYAAACGRSEQDRKYFQRALLAASERLSPADEAILKVLDRWLGGENLKQVPPGSVRQLRQRVLRRFHQLTSPAAAKAVEDTAFYRYGVLLSRNDVGFDPEHFSAPLAEFHRNNVVRALDYPISLITTATHDHKRGEDTRARLAVISERAAWYVNQVRDWQQSAAPLRSVLADVSAPSPGDEMMLYQTLLASWPLELDSSDQDGLQVYCDRLLAWQKKALREAKLMSSWSAPDSSYETACREFLTALLLNPEHQVLRGQIAHAAASLAPAGALNSLAQCLIRLTAPGVPDLYQGTEFWDFSLVDPDNRRPVDYSARQSALNNNDSPERLLAVWHDGRIKQWLIATILDWRRKHPDIFRHGNYQPLETSGEHANNVCAFAREHANKAVIVVVPLLTAPLLRDQPTPMVPSEGWSNTRVILPPHMKERQLSNQLSGEAVQVREGRIAISEVLAQLPVGFISTFKP